MVHDFERFPELTNSQMQDYYFESPHRQITEDFNAKVTKVVDGDTIKVKWYGRDFEFRIRFANIAAAEMSEGGAKSRSWLEKKILNKEVLIKVNYFNRVEKWGRLLGNIIFEGIDVGEESINAGINIPWEQRLDGKIIGEFKNAFA